MYCIIRLFTHRRKFVPEIVPLWFKNRNQRVICAGGSYKGGGGTYTRSNTSVKEKMGLSVGGAYQGCHFPDNMKSSDFSRLRLSSTVTI